MAVKLNSVNAVLRRLGKLPVTALDTSGGSTEAHVERAIDDATDTILAKGWYFNSKWEVTATPDSSDNILLTALESSATIYHVDSWGGDAYRHVTQRNTKLYDLDNNTDTFTGNILLTYTYAVAYTEIPIVYAEWIETLAAFNFNRQYIGDSAKDGMLRAELVDREATARREENESADVNVLDTTEARQLLGRPRMKNRSVYE